MMRHDDAVHSGFGKTFLMLLFVGLLAAVIAAPAQAQESTAENTVAQDVSTPADNAFVHFFVVPAKAPEGRDFRKEITGLKKILISKAGGFTELGRAHGGHLRQDGNINHQENISFVVASKVDLRKDIENYIREHFEQEHPFVVVTRGWCSLY